MNFNFFGPVGRHMKKAAKTVKNALKSNKPADPHANMDPEQKERCKNYSKKIQAGPPVHTGGSIFQRKMSGLIMKKRLEKENSTILAKQELKFKFPLRYVHDDVHTIVFQLINVKRNNGDMLFIVEFQDGNGKPTGHLHGGTHFNEMELNIDGLQITLLRDGNAVRQFDLDNQKYEGENQKILRKLMTNHDVSVPIYEMYNGVRGPIQNRVVQQALIEEQPEEPAKVQQMTTDEDDSSSHNHEGRRLAQSSETDTTVNMMLLLPILLLLLFVFKRFSQSRCKNDEENHDQQDAEVDSNIV